MTIYLERSLTGTDADDRLTDADRFVGDDNVDAYLSIKTIFGLGGDDLIITGKGSADYVDAGAGDDVVNGKSGFADTVHGGEGDDTINYVNSLWESQVYGDAGDDTVKFAFSDYNNNARLHGGDGVDTLFLSGYYKKAWVTDFEVLTVTGKLRIYNGQLSDFDLVNVGAQSITFIKSADLADAHFADGATRVNLIGSNSSDNFDLAGENRDFSIVGNGGDDIVIVGDGRLFASGDSGIDFIQGGAGNDVLSAGWRSMAASTERLETVLAGGGDDVVVFMGSAGVYDGGDGVDTFRVSGHDGRNMALPQGAATNFELLELGRYSTLTIDQIFLDTLQSISGDGLLKFSSAVTINLTSVLGSKTLDLTGSDDDDSVTVKSATHVTFDGRGGDDVYRAGAVSVDLDGGDDNDRLYGSSDDDTISGGAGNDTIDGGAGDDWLDADNGWDIVKAGTGDDILHMGALTASDHQTLYGEAGVDHFIYGTDTTGGHNTPWVLKEAATVHLVGGGGEDRLTISGNLRNFSAEGIEDLQFFDEIWVRPDFLSDFEVIDAQVIWPNVDAKIHLASSGTWTWRGGDIAAAVYGDNGAQTVDFSGATGRAKGFALGGGNDAFLSGESNDTVLGQAGADRFVASQGDDIFVGGAGHDVYVAAGNSGIDLFDDFQAKGVSSDVIDLSDVTAITSYQDLKAHHLKTSGGYLFIDMGAEGKIVFGASTHTGDLTEANFLF